MLDIKDLYEKDYLGKEVEICGWIKNHRKQANMVQLLIPYKLFMTIIYLILMK